jgi:glutamate synthase domain-containing protein 3
MKFIDAAGVSYQVLNEIIHRLLENGEEEIFVKNVFGHRFVGCGVKGSPKIIVEGIPGNDLGSYMDGPRIEVLGNSQDGIGNTMNDGTIVVHGHAGDIVGYSMRGGAIYIRGNVGYRSGIHMKAFEDKYPVIVVGGRAGNFLGEYMAGGIIIVLGQGASSTKSSVGDYVGTGMHGGAIYIRGGIESEKLAKEVMVSEIGQEDMELLKKYVERYNGFFKIKMEVKNEQWTKLVPASSSPYGEMYSHK